MGQEVGAVRWQWTGWRTLSRWAQGVTEFAEGFGSRSSATHMVDGDDDETAWATETTPGAHAGRYETMPNGCMVFH